MHGRVDAFTIVFQPGGMLVLFSVPAEKLTNDHFDGEAALGRGLGELERRLGDAASFTDRVRVADEYLCAKRPAFCRAQHFLFSYGLHELVNVFP